MPPRSQIMPSAACSGHPQGSRLGRGEQLVLVYISGGCMANREDSRWLKGGDEHVRAVPFSRQKPRNVAPCSA
jgi:hypothetical protein